MKRSVWIISFTILSWLVFAQGMGAKIGAQSVHQGHGELKEQKRKSQPDRKPVTESIQRIEERQDLTPGTVQISPERQQLIGVRLGTVERMRLQKLVKTTGRVDYDEKRLFTISPKIGGWIENLYVDFTGAFVKQGDPLLTIYSPELVSTQEEYLIALRMRKDLTSSPFPEVVASGLALVESAKRRLELWDITDEQIKALEETGQPKKALTLYSPYTGFVLEKTVYKGMNVMPGMALYKLADLSVVWIHADVYEYELPLIRLGQIAAVRLSYFPREVFRGKAIYLYPSLDPKTRTAKVRFEFPNIDGRLKPEMYADVEIKVDIGEKLAVPEGAIVDTGVRQVAFIARGAGYFEPRQVRVGVKVGEYYEVIQGLKAGERVVTSANFLIDSESKFKEALEGMGGSPGGPHGHKGKTGK